MVNKMLWLGAFIVAFGLSSCSDDDISSIQPVNGEVVTNGVSAYAESAVVQIPIQANKAWTASVDEDCDWLTVVNEGGNGAGVLSVVLDDNIGGNMRTTIISVKSGDETSEVKVSQYGEVEGFVADNGNADYIQTAATKKLGVGCNFIEFYDNPSVGLSYKRNSAFNIAALKKLNDSENIDYYGLVSTTPRSKLEFQEAKMDSVLDKTDSLSVKFSLSISYGKFSFGIGGEYHGNEDVKSHSLRLGYGADYPTLDAGIAYEDALTHYYNYLDEQSSSTKSGSRDNDDEDIDEYRKSIMTTGLAKIVKNLQQAVADKNKTNIKGNIKKLISNYGTGIVVGSTLGGNIVLDLSVDSAYIESTMSIDSAYVTIGFETGLFKLDANVSVDYLNSSIELLQNSCYQLDVSGGDMTKAAAVIEAMSNPTYNNTIPTLINEWAQTITNGDDATTCNADLLDVEIVPIWEMVDDFESQEAIISYLKELYPNSKFIQKYENGDFEGAVSSTTTETEE